MMAVKRGTVAPVKGPGYALLELDGDPGSDRLEIPVLDIFRDAMGRYVGEGFDDARLDVLFLAMQSHGKGRSHNMSDACIDCTQSIAR